MSTRTASDHLFLLLDAMAVIESWRPLSALMAGLRNMPLKLLIVRMGSFMALERHGIADARGPADILDT